MKKCSFYVGLNDKDTKTQEIGTVDAFKIAANIFTSTTGGATIHEARGIYTHDNGEIVVENTLICDVFGDIPAEAITETAHALRAAFNQESIIIEQTETKTDFFRG